MRTSIPLVALLALAAFAALAGCGGAAPRSFYSWDGPARPRVAILPLANYSTTRDAPDRIAPILAAELAAAAGLQVVDPGAVEALLANEPWLSFDRIPPDVTERFGRELGVDALLVGSVLAFGMRDSGGELIPEVSISLRLVSTPESRILWTVVHGRDGAESESLFGFGKIRSLDRLASRVIQEAVATLPASTPAGRSRLDSLAEGDAR